MKSGAEGFSALQDALLSRSGAEPSLIGEPAFERLRLAVNDPCASDLDRAVLLRQALLYETARRGDWPPAQLRVPMGFAAFLDSCSIRAIELSENVINTEALPWTPPWLSGSGHGVDSWAAAEHVRRFEDEHVNADPFLSRLGFATYRSRSQRAAVRAVLTTPPGGTLAVALATGEGKSSLFRLVDAVGFADNRTSAGGVTLVIVPTLALAVDHALVTNDVPRAWQSGALENNAAIASAVSAGTQGLCFASPEAACGPLRGPLIQAASAGLLKALVIDEAHMIDAWGTGFRTEFQVLSGLQAALLEAAPPGRELRTICLSATLGEASIKTLETLFRQRSFEVISAARLRPEPDYWFANIESEEIRRDRVIQTLMHVPRPAILYVTRVQDARWWTGILRELGFARFGTVSGETNRAERTRVLEDWQSSAIDLVVATSAFGLGINYSHVRSVVHACIPESLDRYYQEVGRGGRDGRSCLSIVLPAAADVQTAEYINETVVIGLDRGRERWLSMFDGPKQPLGTDKFALRLDIAPSLSARDIDMIGDKSTDWNARTLTLLARSGMIRLLGQPSGFDVDSMPGRWEAVEILQHDHANAEAWKEYVGPVRDDILEHNRRNLELMLRLLRSESVCPTQLFQQLYPTTATTCSRCDVCREDPWRAHPPQPDREPVSPWDAPPLREPLASMLDHNNRLVVLLEDGLLALRHVGEILVRLTRLGARNFVVMGQQSVGITNALKMLSDVAAFVSWDGHPGVNTLPPGAEVIICGKDAALREAHLRPRPIGAERIFFVHKDTISPTRPALKLAECYDGRINSLDKVYSRIVS